MSSLIIKMAGSTAKGTITLTNYNYKVTLTIPSLFDHHQSSGRQTCSLLIAYTNVINELKESQNKLGCDIETYKEKFFLYIILLSYI